MAAAQDPSPASAWTLAATSGAHHPRSAEDEVLVARTLAGELSAFETLVERHRDVVYRVAATIVGREEAEDVTQDALLRAFHRLHGFRGEASFRTWLLRIVHNTALNALARKRPEPLGDTLPDDLTDTAWTVRERSPADELEVGERRDRLALKLSSLRPAHRAVLVLRDLEGLSYEEIAQVTDAPLGSVKGRLYRARQELVEVLRHNTYDWELPE